MLSLRQRANIQLVIVLTPMLALFWACGPVRQGYFQPQANAAARQLSTYAVPIAPADTLPAADARPIPGQPAQPGTTGPRFVVISTPGNQSAAVPNTSSLVRHRNPESRPITRFRRLFTTGPIAHVAPRQQTGVDMHSPTRKTHPLAWVALILAGLAYVPVLLAGASTLAWVLSLTLPLTAVLLGVASLTTINRNKDRYRGKEWAMAAVLLGTGVLGLALVAVAALSVSNVVWERK